MRTFFRRIWWLINRRSRERDLLSEMREHREMMGPESAGFGSDLRLMEETREDWGFVWFDRLWQDLSYAGRQLRRSPAFALSAVCILALGIGLNTAGFTLINLLLFRPLPVLNPENIAQVTLATRGRSGIGSYVSGQGVRVLQEHATAFQSTFATLGRRAAIRETNKDATVLFVTPTYFTELGGSPALGRLLTEQDGNFGAAPAVVLSWSAWKNQFGSDADIVGKTLHVDNRPATIIGVASASFTGLTLGTDMWSPISNYQNPLTFMQVYGRLKPGTSMQVAEQSLAPLLPELGKTVQDSYLKVTPGGYLWDSSRMEGAFYLLGVLAFLIFVIACLNLANLLLARALSRERELAIRASIGAGRLRLLRQLITECLLLACLGATAGVAMSQAAVKAFLIYSQAPPAIQPVIDYRVFAFIALLTCLATLLFGLLPSLRSSRQHFRSGRLRTALVAIQVAASCVLLVFSGAFVHSTALTIFARPSIAYEELFAVEQRLDLPGYTSATSKQYLETLRSRLLNVPGIVSVSLTDVVPFGTRSGLVAISSARTYAEIHNAEIHNVEPGYFKTVGLRLTQGRDFVVNEQSAVILSEALAERIWPNENPIGKILDTAIGKHPVIGTTESHESENALYLALHEDYATADLVVRASRPPESLLATAVAIARNIDPNLHPTAVTTESRYKSQQQEHLRSMAAMSLPGAIALLLAVSGLYGLLLYTVSQRTREIGIRMALGATGPSVGAMLVKQFAIPVALGLVAGIGGGVALIRVFIPRNQFPELNAITCVGVVLVFLATSALAGVSPMRRALGLNPTEALRHE